METTSPIASPTGGLNGEVLPNTHEDRSPWEEHVNSSYLQWSHSVTQQGAFGIMEYYRMNQYVLIMDISIYGDSTTHLCIK